jgi:hypothetical protein
MKLSDSEFSFSDWKPYPSPAGILSNFRLVAPIAPGIYGQPGNQFLVTSNHWPSLSRISRPDEITAIVLDGGGFPVEVASAFRLLSIIQVEKALANRSENMNGSCTLLIPQSLASVWGWQSGDVYFGGNVKVISNSLSLSTSLSKVRFPGYLVRLFAALRLALGQVLLMAAPAWIINPISIMWVISILFICSCLLAEFWPLLYGRDWVKGLVLGTVFSGLTAFSIIFKINPIFSSLPPFFPLAILVSFVWMGVIFMGARSYE